MGGLYGKKSGHMHNEVHEFKKSKELPVNWNLAWRLESEEENPQDDLVFNDPSWLVNLSVWENLDALTAFIRSELHLSIMKRRREWFRSQDEATMVLWWVHDGCLPTVAQAREKLEALRENGPSAAAFGFSDPFPAPR